MLNKCLSAKHEGTVDDIRTYCRVYFYRPLKIKKQVLCSGCGFWPPCPDLNRCSKNKPDVRKVFRRMSGKMKDELDKS